MAVRNIPQIVGCSGVCIEGCLSFPNRFVKTIRPQKVTIRALNELGEEILLTGEDEMAKCFCHELEHLDGKIFLDNAIDMIVSRGNTLVVIEHNLDVMKQADWLIDIGPDGGNNGGEVVFSGTPSEMLRSSKTLTADSLRASCSL